MNETIGDHMRRLWRRGDVSLFVAPWPITITNPPRDAGRLKKPLRHPTARRGRL